MPLLLYLLSTFRINSYIAHRELGGTLTHVDFALGLVNSLHSRKNDVPITRKKVLEDEPTARSTKHRRLRKNVDSLPEIRLRHPETHMASFYQWRKGCFYCRYKVAADRRDGKKAYGTR